MFGVKGGAQFLILGCELLFLPSPHRLRPPTGDKHAKNKSDRCGGPGTRPWM